MGDALGDSVGVRASEWRGGGQSAAGIRTGGDCEPSQRCVSAENPWLKPRLPKGGACAEHHDLFVQSASPAHPTSASILTALFHRLRGVRFQPPRSLSAVHSSHAPRLGPSAPKTTQPPAPPSFDCLYPNSVLLPRSLDCASPHPLSLFCRVDLESAASGPRPAAPTCNPNIQPTDNTSDADEREPR